MIFPFSLDDSLADPSVVDGSPRDMFEDSDADEERCEQRNHYRPAIERKAPRLLCLRHIFLGTHVFLS
jgi:hypothetical protein